MPLIASNIVFAPPPAEPEVKQRIVISGADWKKLLSNQLEMEKQNNVSAESGSDNIIEPPAPKPKKVRKKSEKLVEYKESSFMSDMLSDHKE